MEGVVGDVVRGSRRRVPARGGDALRLVARQAQRRDHAQPVEDRLPGGDRLGLRADRLPPLQLLLRRAALRRPAAVLQGRLEPRRLQAAGRLRLRGDAVQLHRHRRQSADLARHHGQHRPVEAGLDGTALGLLRDAPAGGRRPASRSHQLRAGLGRPSWRPRAGERRFRRHPLHRLDARLPGHVEHHRRQHRRLPLLPAHRRRDGRQGLRLRPSFGRRRAARGGADPGRLRVPGTEVLGGLARLRAELALARRALPRWPTRCRRSPWARRPTSATSWPR